MKTDRIPTYCELCVIEIESHKVRFIWTDPNPRRPEAKLYVCGGLCRLYFIPDTATLELLDKDTERR